MAPPGDNNSENNTSQGLTGEEIQNSIKTGNAPLINKLDSLITKLDNNNNSGGSAPNDGGGGSGTSISVVSSGGTNQSATAAVAKTTTMEKLGMFSRNLGTAGVNVMTAMENQIKRNAELAAELKDRLEYFNNARKELGNIAVDLNTGAATMTGITKQYVEQYEEIFKSATESITDSTMEFKEGFGVFSDGRTLDPMYDFFESAQKAAELFGAIIKEVGTDTPMVVKEISDLEAKRITFFSQTLQLAERDIAKILKRQYAFTGEASDELLGQIGTTSKALSEATGISANQVKQGIVEIMRDVDKFGDIGVDSAGRISAALGQLGVDFQSFQSLTDQFMNFDSAANKMGELSTLFGVQLDAMEMTYLANEDQEEFLFKMREEILDAGIDVENISKTRARALASQLNMSVTEMKTFLREGELAVDQTGLETASARADDMDALTVAGRDFGDQFARSTQKAADALNEKFQKQVINSRKEVNALRGATVEFANAFGKIDFPDEFTEISKAFTNTRTELKKVESQLLDLFIEVASNGMEAAGKLASNYIVGSGLGTNTGAAPGEQGGSATSDRVQGNTGMVQSTSTEETRKLAEQQAQARADFLELIGASQKEEEPKKTSEPTIINLALDGYGLQKWQITNTLER